MTDPVMLLSQVHAEGRVTYNALTEAGYDTLDAIASEDVQRLAERARLSAGTALRLRDGARTMLRKGVEAVAEAAAAAAGGSRPRDGRIAGRTSAPGMPFTAGLGRDEASVLFGPRPVIEIIAEPAQEPESPPPAAAEAADRTLREDPEYAQFLPERPREVIAAAARAAEALRAKPLTDNPRGETTPPVAAAVSAEPMKAEAPAGKPAKETPRPTSPPDGVTTVEGSETSDPPDGTSDPPVRFWSFG